MDNLLELIERTKDEIADLVPKANRLRGDYILELQKKLLDYDTLMEIKRRKDDYARRSSDR